MRKNVVLIEKRRSFLTILYFYNKKNKSRLYINDSSNNYYKKLGFFLFLYLF